MAEMKKPSMRAPTAEERDQALDVEVPPWLQSELTEQGMPTDPLKTVAFGGPRAIPELRRLSGELVKQMREKGLAVPGTNTFAPVPPALMEAMEWVQKKYPRLMGHFTNIVNMPEEIGKETMGIQRQALKNMGPDSKAWKLSEMALRADRDGLFKKAKPEDFVNTISHELLHGKDQLLDKAFDVKYKAADKALGYWDSPFEVRARDQGRNSALKFIRDKKLATGGDSEAVRSGWLEYLQSMLTPVK